MVVKKLIALNLGLAIFGGIGQLESVLPTVEHEEIDTQRIRTLGEEVLTSEEEVAVDEMPSKSLDIVFSAFKEKKEALEVERQVLLSEPHMLIEIELIEKYDNQVYFYEHNAEIEPRIYVDMMTFEHWGIDDMQIGDTVTGIFDSTGWELYGFMEGESKDVGNIKELR